MSLAANFARRLFPNQNIEAGEYPARVHYMMEHLKSDKISKWDDPFPSVATRSDCEAFVSDHKLKFEEFIDLLNYLLRWAFPFQTASRELLDHENLQEMAYYGMLKQNNLMNSFILLEQGTH